MWRRVYSTIPPWCLVILSLLLVALPSCQTNRKFGKDSVQYASTITENDGVIWYVTNDAINCVQYVEIESNTHGSLCSDPLCDHLTTKCLLFNLKAINLTICENQMFLLGVDSSTKHVSFYRYIFDENQLQVLYCFSEGAVYNNWCVCGEELYFIYTENGQENDIYSLNLQHGNLKNLKMKKITHHHSSLIHWFGIHDGDVFYADNGYLTKNGKPYLELVPKFNYQIDGDYLYYTKKTYEPDWSPYEDPENVKYAQWVYDLYRVSLVDNMMEEELLIEKGYGGFVVNDNEIYYLPYDISIAFSYPMPYGIEGEMVYTYDMSSGKINKVNMNTKEYGCVFCKEGFLIEQLLSSSDNGIILYGTDYRNIDTHNATATDYYENSHYYCFNLCDDRLNEIEFPVEPAPMLP